MKKKKTITGNIINLLSIAVFVILLFNPTAKSLLIRGLMGIGFFKPEIPAPASGKDLATPLNITFKDSTGKLLNTSDLKGKVVFINFWATWCPPCIAEMPAVNDLYKRHKNSPNIIFILADVDNDYKKASAFMKAHQYSLPVYTLAGTIPKNIMDGTIPTTLVLNKKGQLTYKHTNTANYNTNTFTGYLSTLINQ